MNSRRKAVGAARPLQETRLVGSLSGALSLGSTADPTIAICERWLAANAEIERLQIAWGRYEHRLCLKHNWYRLSQAEQDALPEGRTLDEMDKQMDALGRERVALVEALPKTPAKSTAAVAATLKVAAGLFFPDDHPEAHELVMRAVQDLSALGG